MLCLCISILYAFLGGDPFGGGNPFGGMNAEDILKSFFGGNNAGPFGSNFASGGFQEAAQVEWIMTLL